MVMFSATGAPDRKGSIMLTVRNFLASLAIVGAIMAVVVVAFPTAEPSTAVERARYAGDLVEHRTATTVAPAVAYVQGHDNGLTIARDADGIAVVSPDGTAVAFVTWDEMADCTVAPATSRPEVCDAWDF